MSWNLITFEASDGVVLNGILSRLDNPKAILLYVHGLTSSFTSEYPILKALEKNLRDLQIGVMAFNNRGYGYVNRFKKKDKNEKDGFKSLTIGGSYENFKDCQLDIEGAIRYITEHILCDVILCGISTGANKCVYYLANSVKSPVSGLILLSAVSDIEAFGQNPKILRKLEENSHKLIQSGKGNSLLENIDDQFPFSADRMASLVNTESLENTFPYIDKRPDFKLFRKITQPVFLIYGQNDEYMLFDKKKAIEIFKTQANKAYSFSAEIIRGADHGFDGKEETLSHSIAKWIEKELI